MADFSLELKHRANEGRIIVGVDEVGRGPWAGPVTTAAVYLQPDKLSTTLLEQLDDSKKIAVKKRERLAEHLLQACETGGVSVAFGEASVEEIDQKNVLAASLMAMARAVSALQKQLDQTIDYALIDGNKLPPDLCCPGEAIVKGDGQSWSIAAASILAKTRRDHSMRQLAEHYPGYGWERNAGYGTKEHQAALLSLGPTDHHRLTFRPVAECLSVNALLTHQD